MADILSVAEEFITEKQEANQNRNRKLTLDRKHYNNGDLAQTEGLKPIKINKRRNNNKVIIDDDFEIDLKRVRSLDDVI